MAAPPTARRAAYAAARRGAAEPVLRAQVYRGMGDAIGALAGAWGTMERIGATPLPFVYVAHLRTFLVLYLLVAAGAASSHRR